MRPDAIRAALIVLAFQCPGMWGLRCDGDGLQREDLSGVSMPRNVGPSLRRYCWTCKDVPLGVSMPRNVGPSLRPHVAAAAAAPTAVSMPRNVGPSLRPTTQTQAQEAETVSMPRNVGPSLRPRRSATFWTNCASFNAPECGAFVATTSSGSSPPRGEVSMPRNVGPSLRPIGQLQQKRVEGVSMPRNVGPSLRPPLQRRGLPGREFQCPGMWGLRCDLVVWCR